MLPIGIIIIISLLFVVGDDILSTLSHVSRRPFSPIVVSFLSRQTAWQGYYNENRKVHVLSSIVRRVVYLLAKRE